MLFACSKLHLELPERWLARYWVASKPALDGFIAQGFSNTILACSELRIQPPDDWMEHFWKASADALGQFLPQGLANTLYACGQLGVAPPDWWMQCFWDASAAALGQFTAQGLSNTLYACGQMGIVPPDAWREQFWNASLPAMERSNAQDFANTLYACGQVGIVPPPDWMKQFWEASAALLDRFNEQDCSNILYAVALLSLWECPVLNALWQRLLVELASSSVAKDRALYQLFHVHLVMDAERPGLLVTPSAALLEAARQAWRQSAKAQIATSSDLHESVSACVTIMSIAHTNEHWCERCEHSIDIALLDRTPPIALEVDGPTHFLQNGQPDGPTRMRDRLLKAHGWRVAVVDGRAWRALPTQTEREAYLTRLIDAATAAPLV